MFSNESLINFGSLNGNSNWIFVDNAHIIKSDKKGCGGEYKGCVKISLYDQDKDSALIGIMDAGAEGTSTFCVPLEDIVHF
jgi:hypothetical protein